jgi:hypothetical protein
MQKQATKERKKWWKGGGARGEYVKKRKIEK